MSGDFIDDLDDRDDDEKLIDRHLTQLMEHWDSVQIFASRNQPDAKNGGVTVSCSRGLGNFQARLGHVWEWLIMQDQRCRNKVTKDDAEDEE